MVSLIITNYLPLPITTALPATITNTNTTMHVALEPSTFEWADVGPWLASRPVGFYGWLVVGLVGVVVVGLVTCRPSPPYRPKRT